MNEVSGNPGELPAAAGSACSAGLGVGTFHEFLERKGFQADACEACEHPDFYALTEELWEALETIRRNLKDTWGENANRTVNFNIANDVLGDA